MIYLTDYNKINTVFSIHVSVKLFNETTIKNITILFLYLIFCQFCFYFRFWDFEQNETLVFIFLLTIAQILTIDFSFLVTCRQKKKQNFCQYSNQRHHVMYYYSDRNMQHDESTKITSRNKMHSVYQKQFYLDINKTTYCHLNCFFQLTAGFLMEIQLRQTLFYSQFFICQVGKFYSTNFLQISGFFFNTFSTDY